LEKVYLDKSAVTDQLVEDIYRPSCDPGAAEVFASVFKTPQGEKVDILLSRLSCPLLLIWGQGDPWMNVRQRATKFRQYYPKLDEHYLQAGHCPHDEVPDQVNRLIKDWIVQNFPLA
jgi:pimeloyl-ACP methyl ester carboxylesterase